MSETTLRSATRCSRPPAPGLVVLSNVGLAQVLALFLSLALALDLALVLAWEIDELGEIPG